jgi:hypothetical protein
MTCNTLGIAIGCEPTPGALRTLRKITEAPSKSKAGYLPRRGTLVLDNREGTVIAVESGCLWVTLERDPRDVILVKGTRFEIDRTGRTVVVAEEDSRFRLLSSETRLERAGAWIARLAGRARTRWTAARSRRAVPYY